MARVTYFVDPAARAPGKPDNPERPFPSLKAVYDRKPGRETTILIRRGSVLPEAIVLFSGLAPDRPAKWGAYGEGSLPTLTGANPFRWPKTTGARDVEVANLRFYQPTMCPSDPAFTGKATGKAGWVLDAGTTCENLRVRDCVFDHIAVRLEAWQAPLAPENVVTFESCVFARAWGKPGEHISGLYARKLGLVLQECIFTECGWRPDLDQEENHADMFNHGVYLNGMTSLTVAGCAFDRPSCIGLKLRSDATDGFGPAVVTENLFYDCELAISAGDTPGKPFRFSDLTITDNVIFQPGLTIPTDRRAKRRNLAWGIYCSDWRRGIVRGNVIADYTRADNRNSSFIMLEQSMGKVAVSDNYLHKAKMRHGLRSTAVGEGLQVNAPTPPPASGVVPQVNWARQRQDWRDAWKTGVPPDSPVLMVRATRHALGV